MDDFELFRECLQNLNDPQKVNEANDNLNSLSLNNTSLFLTFAAKVVLNYCNSKENPTESENNVILSLAAIHNTCIPKRITSISEIKKYWNLDDPISNEMRPLVKEAISKSLSIRCIQIRRMACAALAAVLQIEGSNWIEIIPLILTNTSDTDPLNIGAIMAFSEIFDLNVIPTQIPFDSINLDSYITLLKIIFNILTNFNPEVISQAVKIDTAICLRQLISHVSLLFSREITGNVLSVICLVFQNDPSLTSDLYRELHYVMLELIKQLYEHAREFIDRIYLITKTGIECPNIDFKIISYHFWFYVLEEEKPKISICNGNCEFLNITAPYSIPLINIGIELIASIDPSVKYVLNQNEFQSIEFVSRTLSQIFNNLVQTNNFIEDKNNKNDNPTNNDSNAAKIMKVINEFIDADETTCGDSYNIQHYTAAIIMKSLLFNHNEIVIYKFIEDKLPYIIEYAQSGIMYLSEASLKLLIKLTDKYDSILTNPSNKNSIFEVIKKCSDFPIIVSKNVFDLIKVFCRHCKPIDINNTNFDFLLLLLSHKFSDYSLLQSEYATNLHSALLTLVEKCGEHNNNKLMALLDKSIQIFKGSVFSPSFGFVTPSVFGFSNENINIADNSSLYFDKDRSFLLQLISKIIQKLKINSEGIITDILSVLFRILQNKSSFLFEQSLYTIIEIAEIINTNFLQFSQQYVLVINDCWNSQDLDCIEKSALCFGILCQHFGNSIGIYLHDNVLNLFKLMISLDDYQKMKIIDSLFATFSKIVTGLKLYVLEDMDFLMNLFNFAYSMSDFRININDQNEYEFAERLYSSLCLLFSSFISILPDDKILDRAFIKDIKNKIFPIFPKINKLHTVNLKVIKEAVDLLQKLGSTKAAKKINMYFNKDYITEFFNWIECGLKNLLTETQLKNLRDVQTFLHNL